MTLGTDGCMKCEVMTGWVLGSWAGHSWSTGQGGDGQVTIETETHASYLGWGELISGLTSSSRQNCNITPLFRGFIRHIILLYAVHFQSFAKCDTLNVSLGKIWEKFWLKLVKLRGKACKFRQN